MGARHEHNRSKERPMDKDFNKALIKSKKYGVREEVAHVQGFRYLFCKEFLKKYK